MRRFETDVLVIGSGGAGLYAAIRSAEAGVRVDLWDKGLIGRSGGTVAGSGIAAVGPWKVPQDSPDVHFRDTVVGGAYLNNQPLVRILVEEAPQRVVELESWGLRFDRDPSGRYVLDNAGGHSYPRALAISDRVGLQIAKVLGTQVVRLGVQCAHDVMATSLLALDGKVAGAMGIDLGLGELVQVSAPAVVLATGGIGQLYPVTTNPIQCAGGGLALALRAGTRLINMEQVQFYPCGLVHPRSLRGFGLGIQEYARLYNAEEERFMARYEPGLLERTTRDRLSRAIYAEIGAGRGTEHGGVYLDARGLSEETYHSFQHEIELCAQRGLDLRHQRAEVAPAAHYCMGGIAIDVDGHTSLPGLFAAGEVSGGVQGGNRLSGNSLAEAVVFGARVGASAARFARDAGRLAADREQVAQEESRLQGVLRKGPGVLTAMQAKDRLRRLMWERVGVVRNATGLRGALEALAEMRLDALPKIGMNDLDLHHNCSAVSRLELEDMVLVAETIVRSALEREESRGAHFREDFSRPDHSSPPHCTQVHLREGLLEVTRGPVEMTEITAEG